MTCLITFEESATVGEQTNHKKQLSLYEKKNIYIDYIYIYIYRL